MEYKPQSSVPKVKPRLIIHGGAGNITPASLPAEKYEAYRTALLGIISQTNTYMLKPKAPSEKLPAATSSALPTALETATFAVTLLENNPLFNSAHGAVFTRDGINQLEASVMVSRGAAKRGVGVMGLRRVKNPILLARAMLEHGDADLRGRAARLQDPWASTAGSGEEEEQGIDATSAQGHTQIFGRTAEHLAEHVYGLEMVDPSYFFTQPRWDEHIRSLERERRGQGVSNWSADEYLPQGTCGAVALDEDGVVCAATSTGGITNKLTGRIGDTPVVGAGFWAEEWVEQGDPTGEAARLESEPEGSWERTARKYFGASPATNAVVAVSDALKGLMADCFPTPFLYSPVMQHQTRPASAGVVTTRSVAISGTGNGDSFLRISAVRTVAAMARFKPLLSAVALKQVTGPHGELQKSAGDRWGKTGEGEGGMIGIECVVVRDLEGNVVESRGEVLHDYNCGGMFRAWIDDQGEATMKVWRD